MGARPGEIRLFFEPFCQAALGVFVVNAFTASNFFLATTDLVQHIDLILDVFEAHFVRQSLQEFPHFVFRGVHVPMLPRRDSEPKAR